MNFNKVILLGRLTRDPEVKYSSSGNAFCSWGMAINRYYNDSNGERQQEVCFVDVKAFGRQAEIVGEYVTKGNPLFVEGRLSLYQYETENGERRNKLSVIAERVQLMPKVSEGIPEEESEPTLGESGKTEGERSAKPSRESGIEGVEEKTAEQLDDIPF